MQEHPDALDYDCMTRTGRTLAEYADAGAEGLVALSHLIRYLGPDSMVWREMNAGDETPGWTTTVSTNAILADIYDAIAALGANYVRVHSKAKPYPKPYPRPNEKPDGKTVGSGAIPVSEFDSWWASAA